MQMVFQDPSPRSIRECARGNCQRALEIHELRLARAGRRERVAEVLRAVGMSEDASAALPARIFRRQRQRIGIARTLLLAPAPWFVADEPVSALDVSVGAQSWKLSAKFAAHFALTYLLISHSLPSSRSSPAHRRHARRPHRRDGRAEHILSVPTHPYTQSLIAAIPVLPAILNDAL